MVYVHISLWRIRTAGNKFDQNNNKDCNKGLGRVEDRVCLLIAIYLPETSSWPVICTQTLPPYLYYTYLAWIYLSICI